ncbi:MAG: 2-isopropylmalate synthase [Actinomycetia bacterium]|nr:2-isopropylmalate synthase [Actinomycetes bacterium]
MARSIKIFDTTLRDGEQSPGCSMNLNEKLEVAAQLELLAVDVIEAGFAISSPGDFESVKAIAGILKNTTVASLSRALTKDIDASWEALKAAVSPRIHIFLATSPIHMEYKLKMTPDEVYESAVAAVKYAKKLCSDIEFSAEDASRSDADFLHRVLEGVIEAGAVVVNVPDTVGYVTPSEYAALVRGIKQQVPNIDKAMISVHCHDDLGLSVANSLAAIEAGADQVECTVNGIGERAGNTSLEEVVMSLAVRKDYYQAGCGVDTKQIYRTSRLISGITGMRVQANKAIVGENAFAHEAGIHQHGVLANRETYEIMTPESIGLGENKMVLGKHSGRHAFEDRIKSFGYTLDAEKLDAVFEQFKVLADKKKVVSDKDIEALIRGGAFAAEEVYRLDRYVICAGNTITTTSTVRLLHQGEQVEEVASGDGPVNASLSAINKLVDVDIELVGYQIAAVTEGHDAQGEVNVKIKRDNKVYRGGGVSTDIVEASILAYLNAINNMLQLQGGQ